MPDVEKITKEVDSKEAVLLDVRRDDEWNAGHPKPAKRFEYEKLENGEFPNLPKNTKIYTTCNSGGRAGRAKKLLEEAGFTNVESAKGVIPWKDNGGEVTS